VCVCMYSSNSCKETSPGDSNKANKIYFVLLKLFAHFITQLKLTLSLLINIAPITLRYLRLSWKLLAGVTSPTMRDCLQLKLFSKCYFCYPVLYKSIICFIDIYKKSWIYYYYYLKLKENMFHSIIFVRKNKFVVKIY
jgi:hypothetical protein